MDAMYLAPGSNGGRVSKPKVGGLRRRDNVVVGSHVQAETLDKGKMAPEDQVGDDAEKPLTGRDLALLLRRCNDGGNAHSHVHEDNVYSDGPANLVQGRQHALRASGHGSQMVWLFHTSRPLANNAGTRRRKVDGKENGTWHEEKDEPDITGEDGEPALGYMKRYSYRLKNPTRGRGRGRGLHTGWSMFEISLQKDGDDKVLCMLCKSKHKPKAYTATSSAAGAETPWVQENGPRVDDFQLPIPAAGGDMSSPQLVRAAPMPAFAISPASKPGSRPRPRAAATTRSNGKTIVDVEEARYSYSYREKAPSGVAVLMALCESSIPSADRFKVMAEHILSLTEDRQLVVLLSPTGEEEHTNIIEQAVREALTPRCGEKSQIHAVAAIKELYLGTVHELGLDSSIVTGPLIRLEGHLQSIVVTKQLTATTQDYLDSFGERISATIFCAYLKEHGKDTRQVWKDAHGVLTRDPNIFTNALSFTYFSLDEATELACSGAKDMNPGSMRLAIEGGVTVIIVKNPYNPQARGNQARDLSKVILSSIMLKPNIVMLDITSIGDPSNHDFLAQVFSIFTDSGISVDLNAISEGKISLTIHPSKMCGRELTHREILNVVEKVEEIAVVKVEQRSIISLIGNVHESTPILVKAIDVLASIGVHEKEVSQRSSKVIKVSLVVDDSEAKECVRALHSAFFEKGAEKERPVAVSSARSGVKRKADDYHSEDPPSVLQEGVDMDRIVLQEMPLPAGNDPKPDDGNDDVGDPYALFNGIFIEDLTPFRADLGGWFDAGMSLDVDEYLHEPIAIDHGGACAGFPFFPGTGESGAEPLGLAEMVEGGSGAPGRVLLETESGDQESADLKRIALKSRWCLGDNGGYPTGLVAAEPDFDHNPVPVGFDDGAGYLNWLSDFLMEDE